MIAAWCGGMYKKTDGAKICVHHYILSIEWVLFVCILV